MRLKLGAIVGLIGAATLGGLVANAGSAAGETVIHVVLPADGLTYKFVDIDHDGLRLGDRVAGRGRLVDEGETERVGNAYFECLVHKRIVGLTTGLYNCTYVLRLTDGDMILKGLDPRGPGVTKFAVLGGTGVFASAAGEATLTDTETETDFVITLTS